MRWLSAIVPILLLAGCEGSEPQRATEGPKLQASLAASWPAAAPARQATFSRDGRLLATSDASGLITIRDTRDWKALMQLHHPVGATSLAFAPNGTHLYSGGYDGTVRDWDLTRRTLARTFSGARGTIWTIDVSPDGRQLASGGEDKAVRLWPLDRPAAPRTLRGHELNIWEVRFSRDGQRLASGSFDHSVKLWDVRSGGLLKTLIGHDEAVVGLAYSPDGTLLATGSDDSTARLWRASDGAPLRTINNGRHVDQVDFSPDGRWLATGGHARGPIGTMWHELTGGGRDGDAVRLWRVGDGALVNGLPHPDDVIFVAFSKDGRWLVTSGEDKNFRLWALHAS